MTENIDLSIKIKLVVKYLRDKLISGVFYNDS